MPALAPLIGPLVGGITAAKVVAFVAVTFFANLATSMLAKKPGRPLGNESRDRQVLIQAAGVHVRYVLGRQVVSGALAWKGSKNGKFYLVVVLAGHQVAKIGDIFFNDERVGTLDANGDVTTGRFAGKARIRKYLGTNSQSADPDLIAEFPTLFNATDHRGLGVAYIVVTLIRDDDVYPTSVPTPRAEVFGVMTEDVRDGVIRFTDNGALLLRWFLREVRGVPEDEIHTGSFTAAANTCDEWVDLGIASLSVSSVSATDNSITLAAPTNAIEDGTRCQVTASGFPGGLSGSTNYYLYQVDASTYKLAASLADALLHVPIDLTTSGSGVAIVTLHHRRYTVNGVFDSSQDPREVVTRIGGAMGKMDGLIPEQGIYKCYPGAYIAPSRTITTSDLRGDLAVNPRAPSRDSFNRVRGTFMDPLADWQMRDFPEITNSQYEIDDYNEVAYTDVDFPFVLNELRAQRLAKIELERHRQAITVRLPGKPKLFGVAVGDRVELVIDELGWTEALGKVFRVEKWELGADVGVDLTLTEETAAIYDWSAGEATLTDPAPDTLLPKPWEVLAPTDLVLASGTDHLLIAGDGTVHSRIRVQWQFGLSPNATGFDVQWRKTGATDWQNQRLLLDARGTYIDSVQDGVSYDVRVRAATLVTGSTWLSSTHVVVGKTADPSNVSNFTHVITASGIEFTWDAIPDADRDEYAVRLGASFDTGTEVYRGNVTKFTHPLLPSGTYQFWVKAYDTSENDSATATQRSVTVNAPGTPVLTASIDAADFLISWPAVTSAFPVVAYEIRHGASYAAGTFVDRVAATSIKRPVLWSGSRTFWVAAIDSAGTTGTAASVSLVVTAAIAPSVASSFIGPDALLEWTIPTATLPIEQYEVRYGSDFASGASLGKIKGTVFRFKAEWSGARTFWVAAIDTAGNVGTAGSAGLTVVHPSAPTITPTTVQNLFSMTWNDAAQSLPVDRYEIRRGATFAGANSLGFLTARVYNGFELVGGSYTYWVVGYDTAGNQGTESSAAITVDNPPGLTVYESVNSVFGGTYSNAILSEGDVVFPVDATETWASHFTSNSYTTPQNQIDAGFPPYLEPSESSGYYEETIDHGSALASCNVIVNATTQTIDGTPTIACLISWKLNSGDAWTDLSAGFSGSIASSARYFKVRITCSSSGGDDLASLDVLQILITS